MLKFNKYDIFNNSHHIHRPTCRILNTAHLIILHFIVEVIVQLIGNYTSTQPFIPTFITIITIDLNNAISQTHINYVLSKYVLVLWRQPTSARKKPQPHWTYPWRLEENDTHGLTEAPSCGIIWLVDRGTRCVTSSSQSPARFKKAFSFNNISHLNKVYNKFNFALPSFF